MGTSFYRSFSDHIGLTGKYGLLAAFKAIKLSTRVDKPYFIFWLKKNGLLNTLAPFCFTVEQIKSSKRTCKGKT